MKRKLALVAVCAALCSLTAFAAYPNATVTWDTGQPTVLKNQVTASGTYTIDTGWTEGDITFQLMSKDGGYIWQQPAGKPQAGKWTAGWMTKADTIPNGTYVAWLVFKISNGTEDRYITAPLKTGLQVTNSTAAAIPVGGTITWAANQPTGGAGQVTGGGNYTLNQGWQVSRAKAIGLSALPVNGGRMYVAFVDGDQNGTWQATIDSIDQADRNKDYNVIATMGVGPIPPLQNTAHTVGSTFKIVTVN